MNKIVLLQELGMLYPTEKSKRKYRFGKYQCFCGNEFRARIDNVNLKKQKSCGCLVNKDKIKHGLGCHRLYNTWNMMMHRCYNISNYDHKYYGARGIKVCDRWHNVSSFIEDMFPSFKEGLTLDRINNDGNYEPSNCRWVNTNIQRRNTRVLRVDNKSGYRGVCYHKSSSKYQAKIVMNSKSIHLGLFESTEDAAKAYDKYVIDNNLEHTLNFV